MKKSYIAGALTVVFVGAAPLAYAFLGIKIPGISKAKDAAKNVGEKLGKVSKDVAKALKKLDKTSGGMGSIVAATAIEVGKQEALDKLQEATSKHIQNAHDTLDQVHKNHTKDSQGTLGELKKMMADSLYTSASDTLSRGSDAVNQKIRNARGHETLAKGTPHAG